MIYLSKRIEQSKEKINVFLISWWRFTISIYNVGYSFLLCKLINMQKTLIVSQSIKKDMLQIEKTEILHKESIHNKN